MSNIFWNHMDFSTAFWISSIEEAFLRYGVPEIFNTDQGSQFTCSAFTDVLNKHGVKISMDGKKY